jgi:peroxiredoxin
LSLSRIPLVALCLFILSTAGHARAATPPKTQPPAPTAPVGSGLRPQSYEPPITEVVAGSQAPDVSWQDAQNRWMHLRDVLQYGHTLLVFAPTERDMRTLESQRDELLDLGVVPVVVLQHGNNAARGIVRRLKLSYMVIPDARGVIAAQFNVLDMRTRSSEPAWFVVDRRGRVRGLDRTRLPEEPWRNVAAEALALPARDDLRPVGEP